MNCLSNLEETASGGESSANFERQPLQLDMGLMEGLVVCQHSDQMQPMTKDNQIQDSVITEDRQGNDPSQETACDIHPEGALNLSSFPTSGNKFKDDSSNCKHFGNDMETESRPSSQGNAISTIFRTDDNFAHDKMRTSLDRISRELLKFANQYQQLKYEMDRANIPIDEASLDQASMKQLVELCQKFREERQLFGELVGNMLFNCNIEELHRTYGKSENEPENDIIILRNVGKEATDSTESHCGRASSLGNEREKFKPEVVKLSCMDVCIQKDESVQTEKFTPDASQEDILTKDKAANDSNCGKTVEGLAKELDDLQKEHKKIMQEHNALQEKVFEIESELCSVEIERDLMRETARYLEEKVSSGSSLLTMNENELISLRKRYKCLNEAFQSSEELREDLEKEMCRMTVMIRELEERLEQMTHREQENKACNDLSSTIQKSDDENLEACREASLVTDNFELLKDIQRLQGEISGANEALEKERGLKESVEEMLANVDKERRLLLKELDELKGAYRQQQIKLNEYGEQRHQTSEQWQQSEEALESEEITELQETVSRLSERVQVLEEENCKLEKEVYQQLDVMENIETENTILREDRKNIDGVLKRVNLETMDQLVVGYCDLKAEIATQEDKIRQYESVFSNYHTNEEGIVFETDFATPETCSSTGAKEINCSKLCSVPRSEYVKIRFQLKSVSEQLKFLKEVTVAKAMRNMSAATKAMVEEQASLRNENKAVKKWLKSMKESIDIITVQEKVITERPDSLLCKTELHEAQINLNEKQHDLEMIKKEKEILRDENEKLEKALDVLKQRLLENQEIHKNALGEFNDKFKRLEDQLGAEVEGREKEKAKVVYLEGQNAEVLAEFENIKRRFECLQDEKKMVDGELGKTKMDLLTNFGDLSLKSVSESLSATKKKCNEYIKFVENSKNVISKNERDLDSLTNVNTELRKELNEAKKRLQELDKLNWSQENSDTVSNENSKVDQTLPIMQALELEKKNKHKFLEVYMKEKGEWEKSEKQLNIRSAELHEARKLLSEKERQFEESKAVIRELEATCQAYENEFEKVTISHSDKNFSSLAAGNMLQSDLNQERANESVEDIVFESESDSTVENLQELQEMIRKSLSMKVQVLQSKLTELMEALCSCQKLNINLQRRLHSVELRHLEDEGKNVHWKTDAELNNVLKELCEKENSIQEILHKNCTECDSETNAIVYRQSDEYMRDTLSRYKEVIECLRIEKADCERRLAQAYETVTKKEQKIAMLYYCIREKDSSVNNREVKYHSLLGEPNENAEKLTGSLELCKSEDDMEIEGENRNSQEFIIREDEGNCSRFSRKMVKNDQVTTYSTACLHNGEKSSGNLKEELDCITAKYVNLRAAFEGCQRQLRFLASGANSKESVDSEVVLESFAYYRTPVTARIETKSLESSFTTNEKLAEVTGKRIPSDSVKDVKAEDQRNKTAISVNGRESFQNHDGRRHVCTQIDQNLEHDFQSSRVLLSEVSFNVSESKADSSDTKNDRMVIEFILTETDFNEFDEEKTEDESLCCQLRAKIQQLEDAVLTGRNEVQRVKGGSFEERINFENTLKIQQDANTMIAMKVKDMEEKKEDLKLKKEKMEAKLLACDKEIRRIKICSFNERQIFNDIIEKFHDANSTIKKRIDELEPENKNMRSRIATLEAKVLVYCAEAQRVKFCSFRERQDYEDTIKTLQNMIAIMENKVKEQKTEKESALSKVRQLSGQILCCNEETQRIKACSLNERQNFENIVQRLQDTIFTMEKKIDGLKMDKDITITTVKELEDQILSCNEEIRHSKACSFDERKNLEDNIKRLQDTITTMETRFEKQKEEKDRAVSKIGDLKDKLESCNEDKVCSSNERRNPERILENLQDTIAKMEKRIKEQKNYGNQISLRVRELEANIYSCTEETRRIKVCSFNEREKLEDTVKKLQGTMVMMENRAKEQERRIDDTRSRMKEFENKILSCNEEIQRVKVCSLNERTSFEDIIDNLRRKITCTDEKRVLELKAEKEKGRSIAKELQATILKCYDETQRVKLCAFQERSNFENNTRKLQDRYIDVVQKMERIKYERDFYESKIRQLKHPNVERDAPELQRQIEELSDTHKQEKDCLQIEITTKQDQCQKLSTEINVLEKELKDSFVKADENHTVQGKELEEKCRELQETKRISEKQTLTMYKSIISELEIKVKEMEDEKMIVVDEIRLTKELLTAERESREKLERQITIMKQEMQIQIDKNKNLQDVCDELYQHKECLNETVFVRDENDLKLRRKLEEIESEKNEIEKVKEEIKLDLLNSNTNSELKESKSAENTEKRQQENSQLLCKCLDEELALKVKMQELQQSQDELKIVNEKLINEEKKEKASQEIIENLRNENTSMKQRFSEHENDVIVFKISAEKFESEKKIFENQIEKMKEVIQRNKTEMGSLRECLESVRKESISWKERVHRGDEEILALRINVTQIEDQKRILEDYITKNNEEKHINEADKEKLRERIEGLVEEIDCLKHTVCMNEQEANVLKKNFDQLKREKEIVESLMKELNGEKRTGEESFKDRIERYKEEISSWKQKVRAWEYDVTTLRKSVEQLGKERKNVENEIIKIREEKRKEEKYLKEVIRKHLEEIDSWKQKIHVYEKDLSILRENVEQLRKENRNAENRLTEVSKEKQREEKCLQEVIERLQKENDSLKEKYCENEKQTSRLKKNLEQLEYERGKVEIDYKNINDLCERLRQENISYEEKMSLSEKDIYILKRNAEALKRENENMKNEKNALQEEMQKFTQENEGVIQNIGDWERDNTRLKKLITELKTMNTDMEDQIEKLKLQLEIREKEFQNCHVIVEQLQKEKNYLNETISANKKKISGLEDKIDELCNVKLHMEAIQSKMREEQNNYESNLKSLRNLVKSAEANELEMKDQIKTLEMEATRLKSKITDLKETYKGERIEKHSLESSIQSCRETLRILRVDIEGVSAKKINKEEELRDLNLVVEKEKSNWTDEKVKHRRDVSNLKEIIDELMQSKHTLIEEIARLSDQKKEGQELMNNEVTRLQTSHKALQDEQEKIKQEKSKLELHISSLKMSLDTLQSAYEESQDEKKQNERRLKELRGQAIKNQDKEKLVVENGRIKKQVNALENKLKNSSAENKELYSTLERTETQLLALKEDYETCENEKMVVTERLKQLEIQNEENSQRSENETSSTRVNNLRKKLKEIRQKLGEEKKQREIHEFEIKSLKERVERLVKKEKEVEVLLDSNRKKWRETETERNALKMDLESISKRKKRDIEGYTSRIEMLEHELKSFKEKEMKEEDGKQLKELLETANEQNKILEMKLTSSSERYMKENNDIKNSLKSQQERYDSELERFQSMYTVNQNEIVDLKKSLSTLETERENKARELEKLIDNLTSINKEKERIETILADKTSEAKKWKKEAFEYKAEISFLRGALNILEKNVVTETSTSINELATST